MRVSNFNNVKNQFIIEDGAKTIFQSYNTIIAIKENDKIILDCNKWDYSRTTAKHRNKFTGLTTKETQKQIDNGTIKLQNLN